MTATRADSAILTFLIADVRGYTSYTQSHGDEAGARLAAAFAEIAHEGVDAHGGEVIELRGDEALAVFTSPREALRAAVELQVTFADEVRLDPSLPLRVGIGLDAGEAVRVGDGYRGGALNLAARLCSQAQAGEVWVSQGVAHVARAVDGIQLHEHGEISLKGLADPVRVFRAAPSDSDPDSLAALFAVDGRAAPAARTELPAALDPVTPIFGRDADVRRLRWLWRGARRGRGTAAFVIGTAGIGKTRLVGEVAATAADSAALIVYVSYAEEHAESAAAAAAAIADSAPVLVVLDDLDDAAPDEVATALAWLEGLEGRPLLVVAAFNDERAPGDLLAAARRLADGSRALRPQPLSVEDVRRIAALYLGGDAEVSASLLETSGGIPRRVHQELGEWAHQEASRRLGAFASRAAAGRSDLRSVEADLASSVVDLQLVREQSRLFGAGPGRDAHELEEAPYKGLASFDVGDTEWFFGRERLVADMIARLAGAPLLGVVGPSGSGKSSAVRAGLVPALGAAVLPASDTWCTLIMRPGDHPLRELDRTLWAGLPQDVRAKLEGSDAPLRDVREVLGDGERLLLVVDQCEEVFTACSDEQEREGFLSAVADAASDPRGGVVVVVALRADFYGRFATVPRLAELLGANHVLVGPPTADEYRRAIEQPALRAGARVEPALTDDLVAEVLGEPGALPLLSTALLELWERREGRTLTQAASRQTGGVRGAVARLAEDAYGGLSDEQQLVARSVLLRLAAPGEGDEAVRRRVPLGEFDVDQNPEVARVLEALTARRLVTVSEGTAEVAHEALLREWPRFVQWMEEDREGRRLHAHLAVTAREWAERGQDPAELYRGARLSSALDWTTEHTLELNELEREFVNASRVENERELVDQRRRNRRLRVLLAGTAVLLALAVAAGVLALAQRSTARKEARVALARQLGAEAVSEPRIDRAMLLARESVRLDDSLQTRGTLLATLLRSPAALATFTVPIAVRPLAITVSPNGRTLVVADNASNVRFYDTRTHREARPPLANHGFGVPVTYSTDGRRFFVAGGKLGGMEDRDARTYRIVGPHLTLDHQWQTKLTGQANIFLLSKDGRTAYFGYNLVTLSPRGRIDGLSFLDRWDVASGKLLGVTPLRTIGLNAAALVDRGRRLVAVGGATMTVWDTRSLRELRSIPFHLDHINGTSVSPDGRVVAFGTTLGSVFFLDVRTGSLRPANGAHAGPVQNMAFLARGKRLVTTSDDAKVIVWDVASGDEIETLAGHGGRVTGLTVSADSQTIYTSALDGAIFEWDLGGARRFGRPFRFASVPLPQQGGGTPPIAVAPDSSRFAVPQSLQAVGVFSVRTLQKQTEFRAVQDTTGIQSLSWVGDELGVASSREVALWNMAGRPRLVHRLDGLAASKNSKILNVAISVDGSLVAADDRVDYPTSPKPSTGGLAVWSARSGALIRKVQLPTNGAGLTFSNDGRTIVVGLDRDQGVRLYDSRTLKVERTIAPLGSPVLAVRYAPDGALTTGSWAGIVQRWDAGTGKQVSRPVLVTPSPVATLTYSPNGDSFSTTGGSDGTAKLWTTSTLQQLGSTFPSDPGHWGAAAYTPDGKNLVVVYDDGAGFIWPTSVAVWEQQACRVAGRNFTREEWSRYVTGRAYSKTCA